MSEVTDLLRTLAGREGGPDSQLLTLVHGELRRIAGRLMGRERREHTLSATALVNEAWLRLAQTDHEFRDRRHFLGVAAEAMRRLLVDHARGRARIRRGGAAIRITLRGDEAALLEDPHEFLALDDAIHRLHAMDPRMGQVVRLRYFAGLSIEETAEALSVSPRTVKREWTLARAWLFRELRDNGDSDDGRR